MHPPFSSTQFDHHLFALSTFDSNVPVQLRLCSEFQRRIHNLRYCNENCKRKRKIYQSIIDQHFVLKVFIFGEIQASHPYRCRYGSSHRLDRVAQVPTPFFRSWREWKRWLIPQSHFQ